MDLLLIIFVALTTPVIAIAGFVLALVLRGRLADLERRLARAEVTLAGTARPDLALPPPEAAPTPTFQAPEAARDERPVAEPAAPAASPPAEPAAIPSPAAVPPVPPRPAPQPTAPGFEERLGTRWAVWVGGVALALGGLFLVRYSIEQGWLGPGARVAAGALLALALIGAGERLRRRDIASPFEAIPSAHVPGALTAAGTSTAFATVYAAYALYGMIGPGAAFVLLGAVALLTMFASALHGPAL